MKRLTFAVDGMTCGGCSASVRHALEAVGVTATVSRNPGRAVVDVEESVAPATIERAIADSGFPATLISVAH
jgi:copper chaperone CopZ